MFDKLIDVILSIWQHLIPYVVINQQDVAIRLRYGKYKEVLNAGIHFKLPVFDEVQVHKAVWTTSSMYAQSLTTKDGMDVVIKAIIKHRIKDVTLFALEAYDSDDAILDLTQGVIFNVVKEKIWDELHREDISAIITRKTKLEARRWGIEIDSITLSDLARIKTIRLINEQGSLF